MDANFTTEHINYDISLEATHSQKTYTLPSGAAVPKMTPL